MRRLKRPKRNTSYEFELDLAPLLAVMVKLVPVMLLSSAFVQLMIIETDLPQAVKAAIQNNQNDQPKATVQLAISQTQGIKIIVVKDGQQKESLVPMKDGSFDYASLNKELLKVKTENPTVFKIELAPDSNVNYKEIVKVMDEARKPRDKEVRFPIFDSKENKMVQTDYMFPDVVFANMMDG